MKGDLDNLRVVLVATRNPLNIGAAARAMSNFGARHLRLVNPYEVAFREARSAVGAAELLATNFPSISIEPYFVTFDGIWELRAADDGKFSLEPTKQL